MPPPSTRLEGKSTVRTMCARLRIALALLLTACSSAADRANTETPIDESSGGGGGGGEVTPPMKPVTAILTVHPRDIWARPLADAEFSATIDGLPLELGPGAASIEIPLREPANLTLSLAAKDHRPIELALAYDGSTAVDGLAITGSAPSESAAAFSHRTEAGIARHELHLGLAHDWFSSQARPPRRGNAIELYSSGETAWQAVREELDLAKNSVLISTWWWQSDFELTRTNDALSSEARWGNTILGVLEKSPATKRVLVGQFLSQDGLLSSYTWDDALTAHGPVENDGFEVMGQANPASGKFWFEPTPVDFTARVRAAVPGASNEAFDALPPIASVVPAREVDLTQWPVEIDVNHATYHQKFVVIDDNVAFVGGMNLKEADWDTDDHAVYDRRRLLFGASEAERLDVQNHKAVPKNPPRKDYMLRIEGPAVEDVADVFQKRWQLQLDSGVEYASAAKPFEIAHDLPEQPGGLEVQITTTMPQPFWEHGVAESWWKALARAEQYIFIEDQYFRAPMINELIAKRMKEKPDLILVVITMPVGEWFDPGCAWTHQSNTLFATQFPARYLTLQLRSFDVAIDDGFFVLDETDAHFVDMSVHSKMLIVDDHFMSVGSTNKNNRGLVYEAEMNAVVIDPAWVRTQRRRLLEQLLPKGSIVGDNANAWFSELAAAAKANDAVYDAWSQVGFDLNLNGAPVPANYLPNGFLYSLHFGSLVDCLLESVGPDQTSK